MTVGVRADLPVRTVGGVNDFPHVPIIPESRTVFRGACPVHTGKWIPRHGSPDLFLKPSIIENPEAFAENQNP